MDENPYLAPLSEAPSPGSLREPSKAGPYAMCFALGLSLGGLMAFFAGAAAILYWVRH